MPTARVCCAAELPATTNDRWYVFEDECGGQILATIPVSLVPAWMGVRRLRRVLKAMCGDSDMSSVYVVEDFGGYPEFKDASEDLEAYGFYMEATHPWVIRDVIDEEKLPLGLSMACVALEPFDEPTKLAGWQFVGEVPGGMGGGRLLRNDMWFHYGFLGHGQEFINRIRRLLGQPALTSFEVSMCVCHRVHNALMLDADIL